jgi:hypothetical protein
MRIITSITGFAFFSGILMAQAGAHGGGFAGGHSAGGPAHIAAAPASRAGAMPGRSSSGQPRMEGMSGGNWTSAGFIPNRSVARNGYGTGNRRNRVGYGYGYGYPGIIGYSFGYPGDYGALGFNDGDDPNQQSNGGYTGNDYANAQDPNAGPEYAYQYPPDTGRPPYTGGALGDQPDSNAPASDGLEHPSVTLVFKDGHTLKIQNYAATRTKIFVRDAGAERDIPVTLLDLSATQAANDQAGVDFSLPSGQ